MRRMLFVSLAALTIASVFSVPTATVNTAVAATTTASPTPTKKDPCGDTKSKWAHLQCQEFNASAPGDEYFGRTKISYLGIDNTFKDGAISAGGYTTDPRLISKLMAADEALQRWAAKYPSDPQLPRSYFLGVQVFRKVYTQPGQQMAWHYIQVLVTKYPQTYFGKNVKASVANGFTEHWLASPEMCPTPLPKGVVPEKTPSATPTPSPLPGQPAVDIIIPPCIQPSPSPTPEGLASTVPSEKKGHAATPEPTAPPSAAPTMPSAKPGPYPTLIPGPSPRPSLRP
ncbi:MAG: hypothetical protein JOY69_04415 [Candidatus Eremiobacteraeota bacterium]|nr:hypothetical protein [Candidatus Eremiobacteraeota bacterium]